MRIKSDFAHKLHWLMTNYETSLVWAQKQGRLYVKSYLNPDDGDEASL
jgi:hypothetical protein